MVADRDNPPGGTVVPFDRGKKRRITRATASSKLEFDLISFRLPADTLRKMDELVASRFDPELKTRSDCLNDAVHCWMEKILEENSDAVPRLHDSFILGRHRWLYDSRQADIEEMKEMLRRARVENNEPLMQVILFSAYRLKSELDEDHYGSPVQREQCVDFIQTLKKEMEKE